MSQRGRADSGEFTSRTEPFRRELLAHCYRMLGSFDDAQDVVQETYLRAWRSYSGFEGRSSLRTWLYRIATNACLTALSHHSRRVLPSGLGAPSEDPEAPPAEPPSGVRWLQPFPGTPVTPDAGDPAAVVAGRDSLRLALIASLQYLPPRQRAVLILREVLAMPATETGEVLGMSTAAVKSALQRARARIDKVAPEAGTVAEPTEPRARELLDRYIAAFENSDPAAIEQLLVEDAALEMPPSPTWFAGRATCAPFIMAQALASPGDWRMIPVAANGQPAVAAYLRGTDGIHRALGIAVLTFTDTGIRRIVVFGDADLVVAFGLPSVHPAS